MTPRRHPLNWSPEFQALHQTLRRGAMSPIKSSFLYGDTCSDNTNYWHATSGSDDGETFQVAYWGEDASAPFISENLAVPLNPQLPLHQLGHVWTTHLSIEQALPTIDMYYVALEGYVMYISLKSDTKRPLFSILGQRALVELREHMEAGIHEVL